MLLFKKIEKLVHNRVIGGGGRPLKLKSILKTHFCQTGHFLEMHFSFLSPGQIEKDDNESKQQRSVGSQERERLLRDQASSGTKQIILGPITVSLISSASSAIHSFRQFVPLLRGAAACPQQPLCPQKPMLRGSSLLRAGTQPTKSKLGSEPKDFGHGYVSSLVDCVGDSAMRDPVL